MTQKTKRTIYIMLISQFLIFLGMSLIFPVEPYIRKEYHLTAFDMGMMSALFALVQFAASPIAGRLSDRWGRKPMMVWGLVMFTVGEFIFAMGQNLFWFDFSRMIDGLSAAMFTPASMALSADITTEQQRAKVIGWLSAAFSGGLILGPGLGGILANISYKFPFWIAGILGVISILVTVIWLPKDDEHDLKAHAQMAEEYRSASSWEQLKQIMSPALMMLCVMILIAAFGLAGFESIYSLYVNQVHGFDLNQIATVLTLNGILSLILQVFLFEWLVDKLKEVGLIRLTYFVAIIGTVMVIYLHHYWLVVFATLLVFEGFDLVRPAITTLMTKLGRDNQGLLNGVNTSLTSVGNVFGPLLSGWLLDVNSLYPYWLVNVFLVIAFLITFSLARQMKRQ